LKRIKGYEQVCIPFLLKRKFNWALFYYKYYLSTFNPFILTAYFFQEDDDPLADFEFEKYCHGVENESKDGGVWGGEPELNALSQSLERSIEVCSAGLHFIF
uniref:OTU domain-containing protein n=1 Tax=Angiostrongylus cantonensis TaxID=6313 RepID=A0A0K0DIT4_ANGCA